MDPALVELLESSATRSVDAVDTLRGDVAELRRVIDRDREATAARSIALERRLDRLVEEVARVDRRCGALVIEEEGPDGELTVTAKPAKVGMDWKTTAALLTAFVSACVTPVAIALASH